MRKRLTERTLATLKPPPKGRLTISDTVIPGFGVRVTATGRRSFFLMYRLGRRQRLLTLGSYPAVKLSKARDKARDALEKVEKGIDPADQKVLRRQAAARTFRDLLDAYFSDPDIAKMRSAKEQRRLIDKDCSAWMDRPPGAISDDDVSELLADIVERGAPVMANRLRAYLSGVFSWAVEKKVIEENPVSGVKKPVKEQSRFHTLKDRELAVVLTAAETMGYPFGAFVHLLALTGQRRGEVALMRWHDLTLDGESPLWEMPAAITKNEKPHAVPLSPQVVEILASLPRFTGPLVFSTRGGDKPLSGWSKFKARLDQKIDDAGGELSEHWTLHDLRRTAASGMAKLKFPPQVIERVLNHSSGVISGIAKVYNIHDYSGEAREALSAWANHVDFVLGRTSDKVVPIRKEAG